jgi:hypothetical protein
MIAETGRSTVAIGVAVLVTCCATAPRVKPAFSDVASRRIPIELWRGGDDGYTLRLGEALEKALGESGVFLPIVMHDPTAMHLVIETNLRPVESGDNPKAQYVVILEPSHGPPLGAIHGKCRGSEFDRCAHSVVASAERMWSSRQTR